MQPDPHPPEYEPFVYDDHSDIMDEIANERARQVEAEGWSPEHDDQHDAGALCSAGATYALNAGCLLYPHNGTPIEDPTLYGWTFEIDWWKPKSPRADLIRAAALIVAEIERIDRTAKR